MGLKTNIYNAFIKSMGGDKDLSKVQIIGKILSIDKNTYHVKTFCSFNCINEFYLDISEIRKYDPTQDSNSNQKDRNNQ